jgi:hypothetical protein
MKLLLSVVLVAALLAGCGAAGGSEGKDAIKLSGTAKKASCAVEDANGGRSIDSKVPGSIPIEHSDISVATCQKKTAGGNLVAEIVVDGESVAKQETSAEYGVVTVSHPQ